jgi:hypothetical protein
MESAWKLNLEILVNAISVLVNVFLTIYIVSKLQNSLNNKRSVKDHFIGEVVQLREEYRKFLTDLAAGQVNASKVLPWFKLMNIKGNELINILSSKYNVNDQILSPYQTELNDIITNSQEFANSFNAGTQITLTNPTLSELIRFQQRNYGTFNNMVIDINDN